MMVKGVATAVIGVLVLAGGRNLRSRDITHPSSSSPTLPAMTSVPRLVALVTTVSALMTLSACNDDPTTAPAAATSTTAASPTTEVTEPMATIVTTTTTTATTATVGPRSTAVEASLVTPDGRERTYRTYVPPTLPAGEPVPLVVALHGGLGSGAQFEANSGFDTLADAEGFIVVYPDGVGSVVSPDTARTWNGGYCCGPAVTQGVDDVTFIRLLVAELQQELDIDPDRIFAVGHSNGGIMAYRLACEAADVFAAVGVQASSLGVDECEPATAVSLIHVHGTGDRNHPIDGGVGEGVSGVAFHPAIDGVRAIAAANGCPTASTMTVDPSNADVSTEAWQPCAAGTAVVFVRVEGASHGWMGGTATPVQDALVGPAYDQYSSSAAIWSFLADHERR
jgi:polyhydroxybutyrate depolymerase